MNEILLENQKLNNLLSFYRINCVFKQLQKIECRNIGDVDNQFIPLLVSMLEAMNELDFSELSTIHLKGIGNAYTFAANFVKLQSAICKKLWKLDTKGGDSLIISRCSKESIDATKNGKK